MAAASSTALVSAGLYLTRVILRLPATITNIVCAVATAGSTLTADQCYAALYDSAGNRVGVTADQSVAWASAGTKSMALTTTYAAAAGTYFVVYLSNGTTGPAMNRASSTSAATNAGLSAGNYQAASYGSGLSATPSSIPLASAAMSSIALWAALS